MDSKLEDLDSKLKELAWQAGRTWLQEKSVAEPQLTPPVGTGTHPSTTRAQIIISKNLTDSIEACTKSFV